MAAAQHEPRHEFQVAAKLAAGGLSCMITSAILNPMDVIKVRLQTQSQVGRFTGGLHGYDHDEYKGFRHAFRKILAEEGFMRGLMRGLTASMLREATYSSLRLGLYDTCKSVVAPHVKSKEDFTLLQKILAGATSGAIGSALANPTDLVKIRFQSCTPKRPNPYRHTFHAFAAIFRTERGLLGLYRGVGPTTVRASILTASQLASYDHTKRWLLRTDYFHDGPYAHLAASVVSGLVTTTATNPVDVVKTRVMAQPDAYKSPLDCLLSTVRKEGPAALMKGWVPNYLRLGPHFVISLPLLEALRKLFGADSV